MKKLLSVLITTALLLSFAACGDSGDSSSKETSAEASVQSSESVDTVSADAQASADASIAESADGSEATVSKDTSEDKTSGDAGNDSSATTDVSGTESADTPAPDSSEDNSSTVTKPAPSDKSTYTVNVTKNSDGTYTVTALLPEKAESGKIVISTSSKLTMVKGSLSTSIQSGLANEKYKRNGIEGAAVAFASIAPLAKGTVAFKATYSAADGAVISDGDITVPEWNLTIDGKKISNKTSDAIINFVS